MKQVIMLLLFFCITFAAKHSLNYITTTTSGISNFPEFVAVGIVDDVEIGYCDSNRQNLEPKTKWMKKMLEDDPLEMKWHTAQCTYHHLILQANIESLKQRFNKSGGVHVFQRMNGCEWDDETGFVKGFGQYGYNGEDFITFDLNTLTWVAPASQAVITKHEWDRNGQRNLLWKNALTQTCSHLLKKYVTYGKDSLLSTVPPSVSLLQKSPSSPVSCHATGFYPDRATMFWRKDGEELHEDVDHGGILSNHDGTFQMRVDLNISSVEAEDWRRYDCVFQLSGVEDDIVTKLDKAVIRTNLEETSDIIIPVIAALTLLAAILMAVTGFTVYKYKKKAKYATCAPDNSSELSEKLNPET